MRRYGEITLPRLVLSGAVAAVTKRLLEWTKVAACAERPVGVAFWKFGDAASAWLSKTVLPPPPPAPHEPKVGPALRRRPKHNLGDVLKWLE